VEQQEEVVLQGHLELQVQTEQQEHLVQVEEEVEMVLLVQVEHQVQTEQVVQ
jgi:hypothetical protein